MKLVNEPKWTTMFIVHSSRNSTFLKTTSFQCWFNVNDIELTLKQRCYNVVCPLGLRILQNSEIPNYPHIKMSYGLSNYFTYYSIQLSVNRLNKRQGCLYADRIVLIRYRGGSWERGSEVQPNLRLTENFISRTFEFDRFLYHIYIYKYSLTLLFTLYFQNFNKFISFYHL